MIKNLIISMIVAASAHYSYAREYKVIFTNYMITNSVKITQIEEMSVNSSYEYSESDVELIEEACVFRDEAFAVTSQERLDINTLRPIPYALEVDGKYEIVESEYEEGLYCSLAMRAYEDFIVFNGEFKFFTLFRRQVFQPFPALQGGTPVIVLGGVRSGIMIHAGKSALGSYGLLRGADGVPRSLAIMLVRYKPVPELE